MKKTFGNDKNKFLAYTLYFKSYAVVPSTMFYVNLERKLHK